MNGAAAIETVVDGSSERTSTTSMLESMKAGVFRSMPWEGEAGLYSGIVPGRLLPRRTRKIQLQRWLSVVCSATVVGGTALAMSVEVPMGGTGMEEDSGVYSGEYNMRSSGSSSSSDAISSVVLKRGAVPLRAAMVGGGPVGAGAA